MVHFGHCPVAALESLETCTHVILMPKCQSLLVKNLTLVACLSPGCIIFCKLVVSIISTFSIVSTWVSQYFFSIAHCPAPHLVSMHYYSPRSCPCHFQIQNWTSFEASKHLYLLTPNSHVPSLYIQDILTSTLPIWE